MYFAPLLSLVITIIVITVLSSGKLPGFFLDTPNERSLHITPTPRLGGIGVVAGILCGWMLMPVIGVWWMVMPFILLFFVSLADDLYRLSVGKRLAAQVVSVVILVAGSGLQEQQGLPVALLALLAAIWMTNLYNFMDGSDGLAGGMGVCGFACYGIAAWLAGNTEIALASLTISSAVLGFLYFNFPAARIFLGDSGSIPLGFLVAAIGILGWQQGSWEVWFPVLVFSPFIVDSTVTLAKRTLLGKRITEAHREHYYQRAIQMGWTHRQLALVEYMLMLAAGLTALMVLDQLWPWKTLAAWGLLYFALILWLEKSWKHHRPTA